VKKLNPFKAWESWTLAVAYPLILAATFWGQVPIPNWLYDVLNAPVLEFGAVGL
jgi:hypothetical protein